MKKFSIFLTILLSFLIFSSTINVDAQNQKTLKELKSYLNDLKAKKAANDNKKKKTQSEINQANSEITKSQNENVVN